MWNVALYEHSFDARCLCCYWWDTSLAACLRASNARFCELSPARYLESAYSGETDADNNAMLPKTIASVSMTRELNILLVRTEMNHALLCLLASLAKVNGAWNIRTNRL